MSLPDGTTADSPPAEPEQDPTVFRARLGSVVVDCYRELWEAEVAVLDGVAYVAAGVDGQTKLFRRARMVRVEGARRCAIR